MTQDIDTQNAFPENKHILSHIIAPVGCCQPIITQCHFLFILSFLVNVQVCMCQLLFVSFRFLNVIYFFLWGASFFSSATQEDIYLIDMGSLLDNTCPNDIMK